MKLQKNNENLPVPIKTQISRTEPVCSGLYPHEVLLLSYVHKYTTGTNHFESFWKYQYGIENLNNIIYSLLKRGYIELASLEQTMQNSNMTVLKNLLKQNNLKVSGKKKDLIERLSANVPEDKLADVFSERPYVLTELGTTILKRENYIHYIHIHNIDDLDIWKLSEIIHSNPPMPFKKAIWDYLEKQSKKYLASSEYGFYRNCKFHKAELACEENHTEIAIELLIETACYDLSGLINSFNRAQPQISSSLFPYESSYATIAPRVITRISECQKKIGLSDLELRNKIAATLPKINSPFQIFTIEECTDIIIFEIQGQKSEVSKIYKISEGRFKKLQQDMYKSMMERNTTVNQIRDNLVKQADIENDIYDEEFEQMLNERLSKLGEPYESEFHRIRVQHHTVNNAIPQKELDLLTLKSMERSYNSRKNHPSHSFNSTNEYLQTKWGTYEMPDPYTIKLTHGPRNDAKPI